VRAGVAKHPDNEWTRRSIEYHLGWVEEHLRLLRNGSQAEDHPIGTTDAHQLPGTYFSLLRRYAAIRSE